MPYLEYLFCERCGDYARLDIDPAATIEAYREEGRENASIVQATILWDYLMYSCGICGNTYKYTYRDVEGKVREYFSSLSDEFKEYFDTVVGEGEEALPPTTQYKEKLATDQSRIAERVRDRYTAKN